MKIGIIFIHSLFLIANCFAQQKTDLVERGESQLIVDNLKKSVKSFEIYFQSQGKAVLVEKVRLTPDGKLKSIESFDSNGAKDVTETYFYDDTVLVKRTSNAREKADSWIETFKYDVSTNRIKKIQVADGYGKVTLSEDYDYRDNAIFINHKNLDDKTLSLDFSYREVKIYSDSNYKDLISVNTYDPHALMPHNTTVFHYGPNNQLAKEVFKSTGGWNTTEVYKYDAFGKKIEKTTFLDSNIKRYSCFIRQKDSLLVTECFDYATLSDSTLDSFESDIIDGNRLFLREKISFADTSNDDPQRLNHGSGLQLLYNEVGISLLIRIDGGKITKKYLVKYN